MKAIRYWGIFAGLVVTSAIAALVFYIMARAMPELSLSLIFGNTSPADAIFKGAPVWEGLWNPLLGTIKLILLSGLFAVPMGLALGIYTSEYAPNKRKLRIITLLESLAGIPSIIVGLFGFVLIIILRRYFFPASAGMLLSAFCLSILVLPSLALNTYNAVNTVPLELRITAASVGLSKEQAIIRFLIPSSGEGIISGLLLAAGRCAEDTAVILMTGAVASSRNGGIFDRFEALPFYIYYTSANYINEQQLAQVFAAAFMLLLLTFALLTTATVIKSRSNKWTV